MRRGRKRSGMVAAVALDAAIGNGNVFPIDLPDTATGARPAGRAPVYRPFDVRADANCRCGTSAIARAQMEAAGWIREGYGPDATIMCAVARP